MKPDALGFSATSLSYAGTPRPRRESLPRGWPRPGEIFLAGQPQTRIIRQTDMLKNLLLLLLAFPVQERTAPPPLPPTPPSPSGQRGGPAIVVQPGGNVVVFPADPSQQPPQQQLPPGTATVEGLVTILGTTNPVPGAAVARGPEMAGP